MVPICLMLLPLQIPENRIYVPDILSHPFLASDMPVKSLRPTASIRDILHQKSHGQLSSAASHGHHQSDNSSSFRLASRTARHASDHFPQTSHNRVRLALADIGNMDLRTALSNDITSCKTTRRVVSDPARRTTALSPFKDYKSSCENPAPTFPLRGNVTAPALRIYAGSRLDSGIASEEAASHGTLDTVPKTACEDKNTNIPEYPICKRSYEKQQKEFSQDVQTVLTINRIFFPYLNSKNHRSSPSVLKDLHLLTPTL